MFEFSVCIPPSAPFTGGGKPQVYCVQAAFCKGTSQAFLTCLMSFTSFACFAKFASLVTNRYHPGQTWHPALLAPRKIKRKNMIDIETIDLTEFLLRNFLTLRRSSSYHRHTQSNSETSASLS